MTVTFFGHRDTPKEKEPILRDVLINLIENNNATEFFVGNEGKFDAMVRRQLKKLSRIYSINYSVVLVYLPDKKSENEDFSDTVFPEGIENVHKRFAISWRNKWMINQSDTVIVYVTRTYGGARQFKEMAEKKGKTVINIAEL